MVVEFAELLVGQTFCASRVHRLDDYIMDVAALEESKVENEFCFKFF